MVPRFRPGAVVVVKRRLPEVGEVVVAKLAGREVLKRVERHDARGYFLVGDNRLESTDSREHGPIREKDIQGTVVAHLPGPETVDYSLRSFRAKAIALYAVFLTGMAVTQLATFEEFSGILERQFTLSPDGGIVLAASIVTIEVFALPYVLALPLSRAFRRISAALGLITACLWLGMAASSSHEVALFGGFSIIPHGIVYFAAVLLIALLACLSVTKLKS